MVIVFGQKKSIFIIYYVCTSGLLSFNSSHAVHKGLYKDFPLLLGSAENFLVIFRLV